MKLSEMTTGEAIKATIAICDPVDRIMKDEAIVAGIRKGMEDFNGSSIIEFVGNLMGKLFLPLLSKHKDDTYAIIGALTGKSYVQIDNQKISETIADVKGCIDKDIIDFFQSAVK